MAEIGIRSLFANLMPAQGTHTRYKFRVTVSTISNQIP